MTYLTFNHWFSATALLPRQITRSIKDLSRTNCKRKLRNMPARLAYLRNDQGIPIFICC